MSSESVVESIVLPEILTEKRLILLVDDFEEDRERFKELISTHEVPTCVKDVASGSEAINFFESHDVDCVLLEYRLGVEDGIDVMHDMLALKPLVPVIILTGHGDEKTASRCFKEGAANYIVKHTETTVSLFTAIENAISQSALKKEFAIRDFQRKKFLEILVHDLRAPLVNIARLSELALEDHEAGNVDDLNLSMKMLKTTATRATGLLGSMETFVLSEQIVELSEMPLFVTASAAKDVLELVIRERAADVSIGDLPTIMGCESSLIQLFQNLIHNGLKYNRSSDPRVNIYAVSNDTGDACIIVEDNGIGIPEEQLRNVFEPMLRLCGQSEYEGSGLGLAICENIVKRQNGTIFCTSVEGQGSQFHIRFPAIR